MKKKIYISGKITGTTDYLERFRKAEDILKKEGYTVINPAKVNAGMPPETTWDEYMKLSLCMLEMCDEICMLDGWRNSKGATIERRFALSNNIKIRGL